VIRTFPKKSVRQLFITSYVTIRPEWSTQGTLTAISDRVEITKGIFVRANVLLSILLSNTFSLYSSLKEIALIYDYLAFNHHQCCGEAGGDDKQFSKQITIGVSGKYALLISSRTSQLCDRSVPCMYVYFNYETFSNY
jgi:hypothetical protein